MVTSENREGTRNESKGAQKGTDISMGTGPTTLTTQEPRLLSLMTCVYPAVEKRDEVSVAFVLLENPFGKHFPNPETG